MTLLERDHLAAHASGRNQGLWVLPDDDVHVPMARASLEVYRSVAADAPLDVRLDAEPVGTVLAAMNARECSSPRRPSPRAERHGIAVDDISGPGDIRDHEPGLTRNVAGAWLVHPATGSIRVRSRSRSPLAAAERGAEIRHHCTRAGSRSPETGSCAGW